MTKSRKDASPWPPGVAAPARRALANAGIKTLRDLTLRTEAELASLHGMGPKALQLLRHALQQQGQDFRES